MNANAITIGLNSDRLALLEQGAAELELSLDAYILLLLDRALEVSDKPRSKIARTLNGASRAPLDAYLPDGADPFEKGESISGTLSFADLQTHLRFAGSLHKER